jgi:FtsH-binding integral membrane protein
MQSIGFTGFLYVAIWVRPVVLRWILSQQDLRQLQRWLIILAGGLAIIMVLMLFLPTPSTLGGLALLNLGLAVLVG